VAEEKEARSEADRSKRPDENQDLDLRADRRAHGAILS
jgi:hypothetical protein